MNILLADDHDLVRDGLVHVVEKATDIQVKDHVKNGSQAYALALKENYDVIVLDISMPIMSGNEVARKLREEGVITPILILTMHIDPTCIIESLQAGVNGYVLKSNSSSQLVEAIEMVFHGGSYYSDEVTDYVLKNYQAFDVNYKKTNIHELLTPRELEVLLLILKQLSNQEIADELFISNKTVESHKRNLLAKTKSENIVGLVLYAVKQGLKG